MVRHPNVWNILLCYTRLDLCAAAKLISPVNASTNSTAFPSCAGSGFYWSKHFNHKCEECLDALYSGLFLKLVITLVTNVRESQDLLTPVLACFSCRFLSLENAFASCGLTSLCNHTGHNCEELSGAFYSRAGLSLLSLVTAFPSRIDTEELMLYKLVR